MPLAARVTDNHICNMADPPVPTPHVGGPIKPPCSTNVQTNDLGQARATDQLLCTGSPAPDFIVTGSTTVLIGHLMAARQTDKTMHAPPGIIMLGSPNVEIGGPTGGATLGNTTAGTAACQAAGVGRTSGTTQQSYNNCSLETPRQIINQVSPPGFTEDQLFNWATTTAPTSPHAVHRDTLARNYPGNRGASGAVRPEYQVELLQRQGVPSHQASTANISNDMAQAVAEGRGVTASLDAAFIWGGGTPSGSMHTVLVTGVQYDQNGNLLNVIVNDTGRPPASGNCGVVYSATNFQQAVDAANYEGGNLVVTNNRIW